MTDYNYHSVALESFNSNCARVSAPSLWDISRAYFKNEARYDFLGEAGLFAVVVLSAFLPLINTAHALVEFVCAIGNFYSAELSPDICCVFVVTSRLRPRE